MPELKDLPVSLLALYGVARPAQMTGRSVFFYGTGKLKHAPRDRTASGTRLLSKDYVKLNKSICERAPRG
jgi:hypothetical protein